MRIIVTVPSRGDLMFVAGENLSIIGDVKLAVASKARIEEVDFQLCKADCSDELAAKVRLDTLVQDGIVELRVKLIGSAGAEGAAGLSALSALSPDAASFGALLRQEGVTPEVHIVARALRRFPMPILLACHERNSAVAADLYESTKLLPSSATVEDFKGHGYHVNGAMYEGSDLTVCYHGSDQYLLKPLTKHEADRAREFLASCPDIPHVTTFQLPETPHGKQFMLMPRYLDVFERCPHLDGLGLRRLWAQMKVALDAIHAKGFAHMDIKPANICMREGGDFILIDLGSVQRFGIKTHSTPSYVPKDLWAESRVPVIACSAIDWWMLAVCIAEKACEPPLRVGGSKLYTCAEIDTHLRGANLPEEVVSELRAKLERSPS